MRLKREQRLKKACVVAVETSSEVERLIAGTPVDNIDMEAVETALKRKMLEKGARELERTPTNPTTSALRCPAAVETPTTLGDERFTTALGELRRAHCGAPGSVRGTVPLAWKKPRPLPCA